MKITTLRQLRQNYQLLKSRKTLDLNEVFNDVFGIKEFEEDNLHMLIAYLSMRVSMLETEVKELRSKFLYE